jgi:DNA adenine methylase
MLKAPFPYAGGKSWVADRIWHLLGDVPNYVEPLCGSAAVLLARPSAPRTETINDADGFLVNAYRAIRTDPEAVAAWCDYPVIECDLHARHAWLVTRREGLTARLEGDPDYSDAQVAGWWLWGACSWIGSGWCAGRGPWQVMDGRLTHLGDAGRGIHRQLPHLGNAGQGIHRQLPHLGDAGRDDALQDYFTALAARLRRVRITCGPWDRVLGPSVTTRHGVTGVFLDPPYREDEHSFGYVAGGRVWDDCWSWAIDHGPDPRLRIVVCGYETAAPLPEGWREYPWKARGGYGSQGQGRGRANAPRERLYASPHCVQPDADLPLFARIMIEGGAHGHD